MFLFVPPRERQILMRRSPCLLNKRVEENHVCPTIDIEQNSCNSIVREITTDLKDSISKRSTDWHTNRPTKLNCLDVLSNSLSIRRIRKSLKPLANGLAPGFRAKENSRDSLTCLLQCLVWHRGSIC